MFCVCQTQLHPVLAIERQEQLSVILTLHELRLGKPLKVHHTGQPSTQQRPADGGGQGQGHDALAGLGRHGWDVLRR